MDKSHPFYTRYTAHHHMRAEILNGLFLGLFQLRNIVARRALDASEELIVILVTIQTSSFLFSAFWGMLMEGKSKQPFFLWAGILGRGLLILIAGMTSPILFIIICGITLISKTVFFPAMQSMFQANYAVEHRARVYSRIGRMGKLFLIMAALTGGWLLDRNPAWYRFIFPLAGVVGCAAYLRYGAIRIRHARRMARRYDGERSKTSLFNAPVKTVRYFIEILRSNRAFRKFELIFFLYGFAFMLPMAINEFVLIDYFFLGYGTYSVAKLAVFQLCMALMMPLAGVIQDRIGVTRSAGWFFSALMLYPLTMVGAWYLREVPGWETAAIGLIFAAFAIWGIAMGGVIVAWNLGASTFAGERDASALMSVHVTLVGVRGLFGPLIGYVVSKWLSIPVVYIISSGLFLVAGLGMFHLARRIDRGDVTIPGAA